jgi:hypothetical protein
LSWYLNRLKKTAAHKASAQFQFENKLLNGGGFTEKASVTLLTFASK